MALGTISGITKNWNDKEIKGAQGAGLGFTPSKPVVKKTKKKASTTQNQNVSSLLTPYNALSNRVTPTQTFSNTGGVTSTSPSVNLAPPTSNKSSSRSNNNLYDPSKTILGGSGGSGGQYNFMTGKNDYKGPTKPPIQQPVQQPIPIQQPQQEQGFDYAQMSKMISDAFAKNQPQLPERQPYQSQLDPRIMDTLNQIQNYKQFDYNPSTDPALQQAQDQAIQRVRQDMSRRGRVFDTYAGIQEQQAAQGLIPEYSRLARGDYDKDRAYQGQVLGALQGADQTGYNRYADQYNIDRQNALQGQQAYQTAYDVGQQGAQGEYQRGFEGRQEQRLTEDRGTQQEQTIQNQEIAEFGTPLSPQARDLRQTYLQIPTVDRQRLSQYQGDFAAAINQLPQGHPDIPLLQAMRANKILSNPDLLSQYGADYGMETGAITQQGTQAEEQEAERLQTKTINKLEVIKMKVQNRKYKKEISEIQAQVKKIDEEAKRIKAQTGLYDKQKAEKEIDIEIKKLEKGAIPEVLKQEMRILLAEEKQKLASAYSSQASGNLSGQRAAEIATLTPGKLAIQGQQKVKLQKEIDKVKKESINEVGIGLQDLYDTYDGDINEFLRNEGSVYNPQEIEDIVSAHTKIVNAGI